MRPTKEIPCLFILLACLAEIAQAQAPSPAQLQPQPIAREAMYGILFREIAWFQAKADELKAQAKPDAFLRNHHRMVFELPPALDAQLSQVAVECARQMAALDGRAAAIIKGTKDRYRDSKSAVPPPPKELLALQAQRKALILSAADSLSNAWGPAQFAFFESLVRRHIGSNFSAVPAGH